MENNDLEKNQSSLGFENEELSIFNQEKPVSKIISDFKPAEIKENAKVVLEHRYLLKDSNGDLAEDPDGSMTWEAFEGKLNEIRGVVKAIGTKAIRWDEEFYF